jgi:hypothetical protein
MYPVREPGERALAMLAELEASAATMRVEADAWQDHRERVMSRLVEVEMLKADLRAAGAAVEVVGAAAAADSPPAGAPDALSALRSLVAECEERLELLAASPPPLPDGPSRFETVSFERRALGDPERIAATRYERYGPLMAANPPVLVIGESDAELLALLAGRGVDASWLGAMPPAKAASFVRRQRPGQFGAVIATQVVGHLDGPTLRDFLTGCNSVLRRGGVLIAETTNPLTVGVPTLGRPVHPSVLVLRCRSAGFAAVELKWLAPATDRFVELVTDPAAPPWTAELNQVLGRVNEMLFGPQEYAVIATAAAGEDASSPR